MNDVINLLRTHRSVRRFSTKRIQESLLQEIVAAGQSASTSSFAQGYSIIRVCDSEKRNAIAKLAGGQAHVAAAPEFLVFCADLKRAKAACEAQGSSFKGGYTEHFITATVDVALLAQNLVIASESLGLGVCYVGGIRNDPEQITGLLQIPKNVYPVFGLCIGYPDQEPELKPRLPSELVVNKDVYGSPESDVSVSDYDEVVRQYYASRTGGGHGRSWSEQIAILLEQKSRPHMRSYLASQGFHME